MTTQTQVRSFRVGNAAFGEGRLTIIAGPCIVESPEHALMLARECCRADALCRTRLRFQSLFR
jgi:3-deoxy-D-arabino-heptulosonate 7-phosphate (DAHP) synthase